MMSSEKIWLLVRSSPDDLRGLGLRVAVHNDYMLDGVLHTFWLMTQEVPQDSGRPLLRAFKGEGVSDHEALDQIRARFAECTDQRHHAPRCPENHYHGTRAPTGPCSCGA